MKQLSSPYILLSLLIMSSHFLTAQVSIRDSAVRIGAIGVTYHGMVPGGDMADRFGFTSQLGMDGILKFRSNFYLRAAASVMFGEQVKETGILDNITTSGFFIGDNGLLSDVRMLQSGYVGSFSIGKMFGRRFAPNPNSGFYVEVGGQFMQHQIRIRSRDVEAAPISGDYHKGYDRLSNGFGIRESFGYRFFDNDGTVNLSIGLEFSQNFTQNRRSINFDTGMADTRTRVDLLSGFTVSWIFPIYSQSPDRVYYR
ncbi:MAG: hypothetical protein AAF206_05415 [Bacteroidota bacterium]